jgi:hypothetical protein
MLTFVGGMFLMLASCAGTTTGGYTGPELPADQTAIVRAGAYANIVECDGLKLGPSRLKIAVVPGTHIVKMTFRRQVMGYKFLYSGLVGSATFVAQAGHRYLVDVDLVPQGKPLGFITSDYDWIGHIVDEGTGEAVAVTTEPLPVKVEWINQPRGYETSPF